MHDDMHVLHVSSDIPEFVEGGCFNLPADFTRPVTVIAVLGLEIDRHGRCTGLLSRIHNLDESRETEGNVDFGDTCIVECTHGHLGTWFTDRLSCDNAYGLTCLDPRGEVFLKHPFKYLLELGIVDLFVVKEFVQLIFGLLWEICSLNLLVELFFERHQTSSLRILSTIPLTSTGSPNALFVGSVLSSPYWNWMILPPVDLTVPS